MREKMLPRIVIAMAFLFPSVVQAQDEKRVCVQQDEGSAANVPPAKKNDKKTKTLGDKVVPLSLVVCEVENALDAYQQSGDVDKKILPPIASADFEFKTVVDTKGTLGIGFYIFKIGGSYDKQTTNDVDFQYVPKSLLRTALEGARAKSFQQELLDTIRNAAKAVKDQNDMPPRADEKDPLVFKQLSVAVSYGVTVTGSAGVNVPINIVTLTAQLDRSKNNVQQVKLVFAPPPKKPGKE